LQIGQLKSAQWIFRDTFDSLRKAISIVLLTVYLLSTTQLIELLKMPVLVEHYLEHKKQNPSITILRFLDLHYMHGCPRDNDYDRDMQLPFKVPTHSALASVVYIVPSSIPVLLERAVFREHAKTFPKGSFIYSYNYLSLIWQPPKA
jgi:hypothetical protein